MPISKRKTMSELQQRIADTIAAAGGQNYLASHFGISQQSVSHWVHRSRVPSTRVRALVDMACSSGFDVTEDQLNPNVFY